MTLLMYCWIQFAGILWRILHLCSSVILGCNFLCVCVVSLPGFGIRVIVASQNEFGKVIHFLSHQSLLDIDGFLSGNFGGLAYLAVTWG